LIIQIYNEFERGPQKLAALVKKEKWYIILPLFFTPSDIFENISQIILMNNFQAIFTSGVAISSAFSSIKMTGGATMNMFATSARNIVFTIVLTPNMVGSTFAK